MFISNGDDDFTVSLVAPARIGKGDVFHLLVYPNTGRPHELLEERRPYFPEGVYDDIELARNTRLHRLYNSSTLPLSKHQLDELILSRSGDNKLKKLVKLLPDNASSGLSGQAEIAAAVFSSGVAISAKPDYRWF